MTLPFTSRGTDIHKFYKIYENGWLNEFNRLGRTSDFQPFSKRNFGTLKTCQFYPVGEPG